MLYRIAEFLFDPDRALTRGGEVIPLEPRAADLLAYFIENPGRIISREELSKHLWDGRAVTDAAISTQIRAVRKALGDDRIQQKFVRTHPRRGFSFIAPVERVEPVQDEVDGAIAAAANQTTGQSTPASPRRLRLLWAIGTLAIVVLVAVAFPITGERSGDGFGLGRDLSIAVLPFENLSGDSSKDYLADAFTEDLITDLSRIRDAFVISRSTSFTYRGRDVDAASVADELGVRYVLEGSLRIEGEKVRINAQLIDGSDRSHLWSDRYDRALADLFDLQSNVTGQIASVLRAELRKADNERQDPALSEDAWDYAVRGNVILYNHQSVTDYQEAYTLLNKAVELNPEISSAWGGLAFIHFVASGAPIPGITRPDSPQLSLDAALRATRADPMNAEPYWLVGAGYARTGQPERGMEACRTAINLNPNMDCGHVCAGLVHMARGEPEEAVPYFKHALELNPRFRPFTKEKYLGLAHLQTGEDDLAIAALNRALAKVPDDSFANLTLVAALALDGHDEQARDALSLYLKNRDTDPPTIGALRKSLGWLGPGIERMLSGLRTTGLADR